MNKSNSALTRENKLLRAKNIELAIEIETAQKNIDVCNNKLLKIDKLQSLMESGCMPGKKSGQWFIFDKDGQEITQGEQSLMNLIFSLNL